MNKDILPLCCGAITFALGSVLFVFIMAQPGDKLVYIVGFSCAFIGWFGRAVFELFAKGRKGVQDE